MEAGFVTKHNQYLAPVHAMDLSCKSPILRWPSAPHLDENPFCLRDNNQPLCLRDRNEPFCLMDHMNGDNKFATIRREK